MTNKANKQQLWQSRIEECQNSPLLAKQWCQENRVAYSTYLYWTRKLRSTSEPGQRVSPEDPVFAQLPSEQDILNVPQRMKAPVSMFLGTIRIEISSGCPQNLLQSLVEVFDRVMALLKEKKVCSSSRKSQNTCYG